MCVFIYVYPVIEAQIPTEEELRTKESIQFPTVTDTSTNDSLVFGSMTPMIEIPTTVVLRELEEGESISTHRSVLIEILYVNMYCTYVFVFYC